MDWQLTPYVAGLGIATLLSMRAAFFAFRHRDRPGGTSLGLALLAIAHWAAIYVLEANATTLPLRALWSAVAYLGSLTCVPLLLHFATEFTGGDRIGKSIGARIAVWAIPVISLMLVLTNARHGLIWSSLSFTDASHRVVFYERGPFWWVMIAHLYALLVVATTILIRGALRWRRIYRVQSLAMLLSFLPPWTISAVYVFRPTLLGARDWTPVGFALSGLVLSFGFQRLHLLDLIPVARDLVVESMQDGVVVLDPQGRVVDANPAAREWIGERHLIGRRATEIFAQWAGVVPGPDIPVSAAPPFWQIAQRGEFRISAHGVFAWHITPIHGGASEVQGYLVILRDVTEQWQAAEDLQHLNAQLEEQVRERTAQILADKEQSEAILSNVSDGVIVFDEDLRVRYANPAFGEMTGYRADEALGHPVSERVGGDVERHLAISRATGAPWQGEAQARHKSGRSIDLALSISPMRDPERTSTVYVCTLHDISRSRDLDRARKRFLDNISHQLRTPVTTLKLYAHLLEKADLTEAQVRSLRVIQEQVDWLQHLVEDILEMASLDSGTAIASWGPVAARTIVDHLVARFQPAAEKAGLQLTTDSRMARLPAIHGDQGRLIQAVAELVDNAVRFTPCGGSIDLVTDVAAEGGRAWLTITVRDTGPGIPEEEQPRIFDRFFRGQIADTGQLQGTGLGLPIANAIVEAHGGHIAFSSDREGTVFTVLLPVDQLLTGL